MKKTSTYLILLGKNLIILLGFFGFNSCATIFIPKTQTVSVSTENPKAMVYVNNEEVGVGKDVTFKVEKNGVKQVVVKAEGHRDANYVLVPVRYASGFFPLYLLDVVTIIPTIIDLDHEEKFYAYNSKNQFKVGSPLLKRPSTNKYINLNAIALKINDKKKDVLFYSDLKYNEDLIKTIEEHEKKIDDRALKLNKGKVTLDDNNFVEFDDTKFSDEIYKSLKSSGYSDSVNTIFFDQTNTLNLEGQISKIKTFFISTKGANSRLLKCKLQITWFMKNSFGEKIDSITGWYYSADFSLDNFSEDKIYQSAVDESFHNLFENKNFMKLLVLDTVYNISEPILSIPEVKNPVTSIEEAGTATVTIKRKAGGHGSGFAISNDGYILTNYHVIAGNVNDKQAEVSIVLSDGEEVPVKIVRFNKMRDIALLKVDRKFDKAFKIEDENSYKKLMEVYTIGTPKSIELGQSISSGLISNDRKINNNHLLQLSISINQGNSGGALFEKGGRLHGIVTSKLVGFATEGVGFAIPSYKISSYLNLELK